MANPTINSFYYPTREELANLYLRSFKLYCEQHGITVNVLPGSADYYRAFALANLAEIAISNGILAKTNFSPLSAQGDALIELAQQWGVFRLPATISTGYVLASVSGGGSVNIPDGFVCTSPSGLQYAVFGLHTVSNNDPVFVQSLTASSDTNLDSGVVVTWDSTSVANLLPTATVSSTGVTGGTNDEDLEDLRLRLMERMANPATGGNWSQVKTWAEEASNAVDKAYVYQSARGSGSYDVALTGFETDRTVQDSVVSYVSNYILSKSAGPMDLNVTTVEPYPIDVVYSMQLPTPQAAGGTGGGWVDVSPWPSEVVQVTDWSTGSGTGGYLVVNANTAPAADSHISVWDADAERAYNYVVKQTGGTTSAITIYFRSGISHTPASGQILSPQAHNTEDYIQTIRDAFATFGPGEKIDSDAPAFVDLFPRMRRMPIESAQNPVRVTNNIVQATMGAHDEIYDMDEARVYVTNSYTSTVSTPPIPVATADAPYIFTLANIGFYYQP